MAGSIRSSRTFTHWSQHPKTRPRLDSLPPVTSSRGPFVSSALFPGSYTPDPYVRWALSAIAVGQSTLGTLRGVNLGASQTFTKVAQVLPGQTDLLSTFNASQLQRSAKLAYLAGAGQ